MTLYGQNGLYLSSALYNLTCNQMSGRSEVWIKVQIKNQLPIPITIF